MGVGVGVGTAVAVGTGVGVEVGFGFIVGVGNTVGVGIGVGVGSINTVKDLVAKLPLADCTYRTAFPGPRYGTSTGFKKLPLWPMYIQAFVMRSTPPIIISVTHSYVGKPCPVTDIVDPGYPDDVFNINLADGTGVGVGVGPGVGVGVGPGAGVGVGGGVAVGGMVTAKDVVAYDDLDPTYTFFQPYPTSE